MIGCADVYACVCVCCVPARLSVLCECVFGCRSCVNVVCAGLVYAVVWSVPGNCACLAMLCEVSLAAALVLVHVLLFVVCILVSLFFPCL